MTHGITVARSMLAALGLLTITAACSAGQAEDPCGDVLAAGVAIVSQDIDPQTKGIAAAQHVVNNPDCYTPDQVAKSRVALVQTSQSEHKPEWAKNWFEKNGY